MHLRWTEAAWADLEQIADYLFVHAPTRAPGLVRSICEAPEALRSFPHRGRPGKKAGTRKAVSSDERWRLVEEDRRTISGQWRAMRDGIDGIPGNHGNVVSVTYRF